MSSPRFGLHIIVLLNFSPLSVAVTGKGEGRFKVTDLLVRFSEIPPLLHDLSHCLGYCYPMHISRVEPVLEEISVRYSWPFHLPIILQSVTESFDA